MSTWLDIVTAELELATVEPGDPMEPSGEVGQHDHEVGQANETQRRLYIISVRWKKEAMQCVVDSNFAKSEEEMERLALKAVELKEKSGILLDIFWASLKDEFKLWDRFSIGLRDGWTVVWSEVEIPPILGILGELFGIDDD